MSTGRLLEDIQARIDIVDFISDYVHLKKAGQNWKGLCPFHQEKTPSFTVSQAKQMFYCFGCSAGGSVITFLMKHDNLSFREAATVLARKAGISLDAGKYDPKSIRKDELIRKALDEAGSYFSGKLQGDRVAQEYFARRGVSAESVRLFLLGYAPSGWNNLLNHLRKAGYRDEVMRDAGLAVSGAKGLYDVFRERVIFPIRSVDGSVIAFGGRAMDDALPKYINSPETPVFKKSETLYGLHTAKEAIRKEGFVIIVEGYMDVIICCQHGFRNVVAPLGTALTAGHLQRLRKMTNQAVVVFDGDSAGISAAKRSIPLLCRHDFRTKLLLLPENEDPDSFLGKNGSDAFSLLLTKAESVIDFLFRVSREGTVETVREALTLIAQNLEPLAADEMLMDLSGKTRISESTIREEFRKIRGRTAVHDTKAAVPRGADGEREEYLLLSAVINFPEKLDYVVSRLDRGALRDKTVVSLFEKFAAAAEKNTMGNIPDDADEPERAIFTRLSVEPGFDLEQVDRIIEDCLLRMEKKKFDERFHLAEVSGDLELFNELLREKKKRTEGRML